MIINKVFSIEADEEPTLLWTNPYPFRSMGGSTITLETGFKAYLVELRYRYTGDDLTFTGIAYVPFNTDKYYATYVKPGSTAPSRYDGRPFMRRITASDGSITFSTGQIGSDSTTANVCVPVRVWGVHWTL